MTVEPFATPSLPTPPSGPPVLTPSQVKPDPAVAVNPSPAAPHDVADILPPGLTAIPPGVQVVSTPAVNANGPWPARLRVFSIVIGAVMGSAGTITAYAGTLGASRWVSVVFAILGFLQVIAADVLTGLS